MDHSGRRNSSTQFPEKCDICVWGASTSGAIIDECMNDFNGQ